MSMSTTKKNPWKWRTDIPIPRQETYNLLAPVSTGDNSLYFSCNEGDYNPHVRSDSENGIVFVKYADRDKVSLFDEQLFPNQSVCILRPYMHPIDLTKITRIELNVKTHGQGAPCVKNGADRTTACAPWFAVWLAPMVYDGSFSNTFSAEINLIQNYDLPNPESGQSYDLYNNVHSSFPNCDNPGNTNTGIPREFCEMLDWGVDATNINHHITAKVVVDGSGGRVLKIWHCRNKAHGSPMRTCNGSAFAQMSLQGNTPVNKFWSPVWEQKVAHELYGKYQLVTNIWNTRGTGLEFSTSDVELFL